MTRKTFEIDDKVVSIISDYLHFGNKMESVLLGVVTQIDPRDNSYKVRWSDGRHLWMLWGELGLVPAIPNDTKLTKPAEPVKNWGAWA